MGNTVNDRELILEILLAVTRDGEYSQRALIPRFPAVALDFFIPRWETLKF